MLRPRLKHPFRMRVSTLILLTVIVAMGFAMLAQERSKARLRSALGFTRNQNREAIRLYLAEPRSLPEFDLELMSPLTDAKSMPRAGSRLVVVAPVNGVLCFRIFDGGGKMVVDTDEEALAKKAGQIRDLRGRLVTLSPEGEFDSSEKGRVITSVMSIVEYSGTSAMKMTLEDFLKYIIRDSRHYKLASALMWRNDGRLPVYVDPVGLQEAERTMTSPVIVSTKHQPIGKTLAEILDQLGMGYVIEDGLLLITSNESLDRSLDDESNP